MITQIPNTEIYFDHDSNYCDDLACGFKLYTYDQNDEPIDLAELWYDLKFLNGRNVYGDYISVEYTLNKNLSKNVDLIDKYHGYVNNYVEYVINKFLERRV
ncbi:MAG: hypothetical protein RML94_15645 [Bacteroidia bacterium]|nr:hypothetical protein [Bacteroidia bacterium]